MDGVHEKFMREALRLAKKGFPGTSPNPAVGAVIVKGGKVISRGYHRRAGLPHAEAEAISRAKGLKGATLYVTLEPCCHAGKRTPPCVDAIITSGIKRVVVGAMDPNPMVMGGGIRALRRAGIEVTHGVLAGESLALNEFYAKYITAKRPFVVLKLAQSLDGRSATFTGESRWITGREARKLVHRVRSTVDAVMVGSGTVVRDDPALTVRLVKGRNPARVVVDTRLSSPLSSKVFDTRKVATIVFITGKAPPRKVEEVRGKGVIVKKIPGKGEGVSLKRALAELGRMGITSVLVEGGGRISSALLKEGLVDRVMVFLSPMVIGGDGLPSVGSLGIRELEKGIRLKRVKVERMGDDVLVEAYPEHGRGYVYRHNRGRGDG